MMWHPRLKTFILTLLLIKVWLISAYTSADELGTLSVRMRSILDAHAQLVKQWANHPAVVNEVIKHNYLEQSLDDVKQIDRMWREGKKEAFARSLQENKSGHFLKKRILENRLYTEAFLCDGQGAVVGEYPMTSDYWQGDEDKFLKSFNGGEGQVYIGPIEFDESSGEISVQISVPVRSQGATVGVLVVGLKNIK
ncbi:MAG: PDC sensor domain-containing protein [Agarilytica sp.]